VATGVLTPPSGLVAPSGSAARDVDPPTILGGADSPTILSVPHEGATTFRTPAPPTVFAAGDPPTGFGATENPTQTFDLDGTTSPGFSGADPSDHGPLNVGQVFGTRYHIIKLLGVGGMGAVYQAWDAELAVAVAIKVIRPEVMADPVAAADIERRFKRELLLAREVTHRNVVRIHDLGEIDGIKYIPMA
jgi:hypothetical protein